MNTNFTPPVPNGFAELQSITGNHCSPITDTVTFPLPAPIGCVTHLTCHKYIAEPAQRAFQEIYDLGFWNLLNEYGGCGCCRPKRGLPNEPSVHGVYFAFDLNETDNPLGSTPPEHCDLENAPYVFAPDHPVVQAFEKQGFKAGESFQGRKDPMHFQYVTGY